MQPELICNRACSAAHPTPIPMYWPLKSQWAGTLSKQCLSLVIDAYRALAMVQASMAVMAAWPGICMVKPKAWVFPLMIPSSRFVEPSCHDICVCKVLRRSDTDKSKSPLGKVLIRHPKARLQTKQRAPIETPRRNRSNSTRWWLGYPGYLFIDL